MRERLKWIFPGLILAYLYRPTFAWMWDRWFAGDSYYGHGILIPLVSLYWLWDKRKTLAACEIKPCGIGLAVIGAGAALQVVGCVLRIYFVSAISFVVLLAGVVLFGCGRRVFREVWFPLAFLFMMIPLPLLTISEITLRMKFFVSDLAVWCLNHIGIEAARNGSYVVMAHSYLLVGDPCSGLRSFLAFVCLGLVFSYGGRLSLWKKGLLVGLGLPLAVLSNLIRIFVLCLVAEIYGMDAVEGRVHDVSGITVGILALVVFFIIRQYLEGPKHVLKK